MTHNILLQDIAKSTEQIPNIEQNQDKPYEENLEVLEIALILRLAHYPFHNEK